MTEEATTEAIPEVGEPATEAKAPEISLPVAVVEIAHPCDVDLGTPARDAKGKPLDWRTAKGTILVRTNAANRRVELVRPHPMHHAAMAFRGWVPGDVVTQSEYEAALEGAGGVKAH
jgi:hypothetical protein